jgi:GNAT superfamily N-acetyltransferase
MIRYTDDVEEIFSSAAQLVGFFVGWPTHPSPERHEQILRGSSKVWFVFNGERCVGFINALSDGVFYAYIPLLEVLPEYQGRGIGAELVRRMDETLKDHYALDLVCDPSLAPFYQRGGFIEYTAMIKRRYERQRGE